MASKLQQALSSMSTPSVKQLGQTGQQRVRAATIYEDASYTNKSNLLGSIDRFTKYGADWYNQYDQKRRDLAEERSNEIIRKLTPEQRKEALQSGTLLYQDDPYVMQALNYKTGRNAAYLVDDEVAQKVKNGEFRTREELEKFRHQRLQQASKEYADMFGLNEADEAFQKGFNADITERNISLYGQHDNFLSDQAKKGLIINGRVELNSVLNDPTILANPMSGEFFEKYFKDGLLNGSIPSDEQAFSIINQSLSDVTNRKNGVQFLQNIENRKVTLNGTTSTFKELLGDENWNNLVVKAQYNEFQLDAKNQEDLELSINSALNNPDLNEGWTQLRILEGRLNAIQTGEEMTPQRQALINAKTHMQNKMKKQTDELAKARDDKAKQQNRFNEFDNAYQQRINGKYVSTSYRDLPTNENTGEFTHSDAVNYANKKINEINNMDIPEEQKDLLKLAYIKADSENGPFRTQTGELIKEANGEWQSAIINGKMPEDGGVALNALRRMRNLDPTTFAALYPDDAELFVTMDMIDHQGITPQILIDAARANKGLSREQQFEDEQVWRSLKNASDNPALARMPAQLDSVARKIYDSVKYNTGNADFAQDQVAKYVNDNVVVFKNDNDNKKTYGVITKNTLMVTDDPDSWQIGEDIINQAVDRIINNNRWITGNQPFVTENNGNIIIQDTTGQVGFTITKERLQEEYQKYKTKADEEAYRLDQEKRNKAIKGANNRANAYGEALDKAYGDLSGKTPLQIMQEHSKYK